MQRKSQSHIFANRRERKRQQVVNKIEIKISKTWDYFLSRFEIYQRLYIYAQLVCLLRIQYLPKFFFNHFFIFTLTSHSRARGGEEWEGRSIKPLKNDNIPSRELMSSHCCLRARRRKEQRDENGSFCVASIKPSRWRRHFTVIYSK